MFAFYAKNNAIRITDLHQGIVWGTQTPETRLDEKLINRFDYDGDYGTVLNRFIMGSYRLSSNSSWNRWPNKSIHSYKRYSQMYFFGLH